MDPQYDSHEKIDRNLIREVVDADWRTLDRLNRPRFPFYFDVQAVTMVGSVGDDPTEGHFLIRNRSQRAHIFRVQVSDQKALFKIKPKMGVVSSLSDIEINVKYFGDAIPRQKVYFRVTALAARKDQNWFDTLCAKHTVMVHKKLHVDFLLWHDTSGYREGRCEELFEREQDRLVAAVHEKLLARSVRVQEKLYEAGFEVRPTWRPPKKKVLTIKKWAEMEEDIGADG